MSIEMDLLFVVNKQIQNVIHYHLLFRRSVFLIDRLMNPWGICNESLASRSCPVGQCRSMSIHENIYNGGAFELEYKSEWKIQTKTLSYLVWKISFLCPDFTLYCLFLSTMVCPSLAWREVEHSLLPGHLHCFSIQGLLYVSTLLHIILGEQVGRVSSVS